MNEITFHGNLTANPVVNTNPTTGRSATTFDIAVNSRYYDRTAGEWRDRPAVFHKVVSFGDLGANAAQSLRKGMTVTVTGTMADDSYTPDGAERTIRRTRLEAADIAVSLRFAIATITRVTTADQRSPSAQAVTPAATAASAVPAAAGSDEAAVTPIADTPAEQGSTTQATAAKSSSRRGGRRAEPQPAAAA